MNTKNVFLALTVLVTIGISANAQSKKSEVKKGSVVEAKVEKLAEPEKSELKVIVPTAKPLRSSETEYPPKQAIEPSSLQVEVEAEKAEPLKTKPLQPTVEKPKVIQPKATKGKK